MSYRKPALSLILPYWDRQAAANEALQRQDKLYRGLDMEVLIIDDGSRPEFDCPPLQNLNVAIFNLPKKDEPKSPCLPWNIGAKIARSDVIVLSCIEILHFKPVLAEMVEQVREMGENGYVLASTWCPDTKEWHCHTTQRSEGAPDMPEGFGRAFCGAMHKSLFLRAGGWDEDYRDGAGWEDIDFAQRLKRAGAVPVIRDDLTVIHPKKGATIRWGADKFARNCALYQLKWGQHA